MAYKLTSPEIARQYIEFAADYEYMNSIYHRVQMSFGDRLNVFDGVTTEHGDCIPYFPNVSSNKVDEGKVNLIRNAARIAVSRMASVEITPEFKGNISIVEKAVRKGLFNYDYGGGLDMSGGFNEDAKWAFTDADLLGTGIVQHYHQKVKQIGQKRAFAQHIPRLNAFWDPIAFSPRKSRWVAVVHRIPVEQAKLMYGSVINDKTILRMTWGNDGGYEMVSSNTGGGARRNYIEYVRVVEYYDTGISGGDPTVMVWVGSIEDTPHWHKPSHFKYDSGEGYLPFSFMTGFKIPNTTRHEGRIDSQIENQAAKQTVMDHIKDAMAQPSIDVIDPKLLEHGEAQKYLNDGQRRLMGKQGMAEKVMNPIIRIPPVEVASTTFSFLELVTRQESADSMQTDMDRGQMTDSRKSATEIATMQDKADQNQSADRAEMLLFKRELISKHLLAMKVEDDYQRDIVIEGHDVRVNDPEVPESSVSNFVSKPAQVIIDSQAMTQSDNRIKQLATREGLIVLMNLFSDMVDKREVARKFVETMGDMDPDQVLLSEAEQSKMEEYLAAAQAQMGAQEGSSGETSQPGIAFG